MRKFRDSMEPFWDLKISKYVEYLARISSEYFTSCVLPSLTSTAYVIPWIALCYNIIIARMYVVRYSVHVPPVPRSI
jgi:hypothetical protein